MTTVLKRLQPCLTRLFGFSLLLLSLSASAQTNFNYNQLQAQFGLAKFDPAIQISHNQSRDEYTTLPIWGLSASYQNRYGLIFSASHTQGNLATDNTSIQTSGYGFKVGYAIGVRQQLDIYGHLGQFYNQAEACNQIDCARVNKQSQGVDFGFRAGAYYWLEWGMNLRSQGIFSETETHSLGAHSAIWIDRHSSLAANLLISEESYAMTLGYRFAF